MSKKEKMKIIMSVKTGMPIGIVTYKCKEKKFLSAILEKENEVPDDYDWTISDVPDKMLEHKILTGFIDIIPKKHILWVGEPDEEYFD